MPANTSLSISITLYSKGQATHLLRLLLMLQRDYFSENAAAQIKELRAENDIERAYKSYVDDIGESEDDTWHVLMALDADKAVGFIIGSIENDESLIKGAIGKVEDWYVESDYRGSGTGMKLYNELENWFKEKGCQQVISDTWAGNDLSIEAHKRSGFFISGVSFSKKL